MFYLFLWTQSYNKQPDDKNGFAVYEGVLPSPRWSGQSFLHLGALLNTPGGGLSVGCNVQPQCTLNFVTIRIFSPKSQTLISSVSEIFKVYSEYCVILILTETGFSFLFHRVHMWKILLWGLMLKKRAKDLKSNRILLWGVEAHVFLSNCFLVPPFWFGAGFSKC